MFNKLSFQKKIFIYYSGFIITLLLLLTLVVYFYMSQSLQTQSMKTMDQTVDKISSLLDSSVLEIDRMSMQVYFNTEIQRIMSEALYFNEKEHNYFDYNIEDSKKVRTVLASNNFYKLSDRKIAVFNDSESYITSGAYPETSQEIKNQLMNSSWINTLITSQNKSILLPPHEDWWSKDTGYTVISLIKEVFNTIVGSGSEHLGYIEVQLPYTEIEKICTVDKNPEFRVLVVNDKGEVIFPLNKYEPAEIHHYMISKEDNGIISRRPTDGIKELIYSQYSSYTNWKVILAQPETNFMAPVHFLQTILMISGILFALLSIFIMYFITRSLTSPIREMRKQLRALSLENLSISLNDRTNNEITIFNEVFNKTLNRMKESMEQTIEAKSSESRAHFLALQAQMNPHFIYNLLMVISSAGYELGSQKIVMICSQLSDMMRYIVAPDTMKITLREELLHLENYLMLLKWRFEEQLQYKLEIDENLYDIHVPKLIIQPLVENSYNHGFSGKRPPWNLKIKCSREIDTWIVEIKDDGIGFSETKLSVIKEQIIDYQNRFNLGQPVRELYIGGMGLSNIYYRLYMLYKDELIFEINNGPDGGATIKIGGPIL